MDLINEMSETQKLQEVKLEELKGSVTLLQEELEDARTAKTRAECLLMKAQEEAADIEERYNHLLEQSKTAKDMYLREMNAAKSHWNEVELELKTTYEEIVGEMRRLEEQNRILSVELNERNQKLESSTQNEDFLGREVEKLKALIDDKGKDLSIVQLENEKNANELHNLKMQMLKERNINDRLLDEVRRLKKELEIREVQIEEVKRDKDSLNARVEELIQASSKDRLFGIDLKELKMSVNMILIGNTSLEDKLSVLGSMLKGETASVSVQTEMTHSDLDQYESLDRQATLMVMGLKEQMLNLKQQYLESRQENDVLKGFVEEVKREREAKEEGERVVRLEDAVRSLSEMVRADAYEPTRESCILQALQDVKNDLNLLKAKSRTNKADKIDYWDFHWTSWLLIIVATFVAIAVAVAVAIVVAIDLVPQRLVPEVSSLPGVSMSCGEDRVECGDGMLIWCGDDHIGCGDDHGDIGIRVSIGCGGDRVRCGDDHIWCGDNHLRCGDNHLRCDDGMPSRCADDLIHHGVGVPIWCADIGVICGVGVPIWCVDDPIYK
ncbi:hypothetical protein GE061_012719 [Apolygus lucorum]|uniref:Uncharacterized protein n=1 Tax=Apolygus lucorum TaxID=248454 RepID=A0A8S9XVC1_APOLU|nr:hypothetical protein GE061_012719 [Apolygus lucorum]